MLAVGSGVVIGLYGLNPGWADDLSGWLRVTLRFAPVLAPACLVAGGALLAPLPKGPVRVFSGGFSNPWAWRSAHRHVSWGDVEAIEVANPLSYNRRLSARLSTGLTSTIYVDALLDGDAARDDIISSWEASRDL